jgi:peroxiredoxin
MKNILLSFFILSLIPGLAEAQNAKGSEIRVKIKGYPDSVLYMGYYYGDKELLKDSAMLNKKGWYVFKSEAPLPCGVYGIINQAKDTRMFEFVSNGREASFSIEADTADMHMSMKIEGSPENTLFNSYLNFINKKGMARYELQNALAAASEKPDSAAAYQEAIRKIDLEVTDFRKSFIRDHPEAIITKVFKAMQDPEVPEPPLNPDGTVDSTFRYRYFKAHYWDNVDFTDDCLVRSPVFHKRLERYMKQMTVQIPDSIIASADVIVNLARSQHEMYRYIVTWITSTYEKSPYMCMDAVVVHMYKNYYNYREATWVDTATMVRIKDRVRAMEPLCCGKITPNLIMKDTLGKYVNLHKLDAKYTLLVFWDPDCSHCKTEIPKMYEVYKKFKGHGLEVYAVGVEQEYDKWIQFIRSHNLSWINVIDIYNESNFRYIYDIHSTPVVFLLDENKKIIGKKLGAETLQDVLEREFGQKDRNAPIEEN